MKKLAFSIIELIVVAAILLTLASIVFSSTQTAEEVAKRGQCMSNLAQIRNFTELYRKDHGEAPDPADFNAVNGEWWRDFSYATAYLGGNKALEVFHCPGDESTEITSISQLNGGTSYYYVPAREAVYNEAFKLNAAVDPMSWPQMASKNFLVIYDQSKGHHKGWRNVAYLFGDDRPEDGTIASSFEDEDTDGDGGGELIDFPLDITEGGTVHVNPNNSKNECIITEVENDIHGSWPFIRTIDLSSSDSSVTDELKDGYNGIASQIKVRIIKDPKLENSGETIEINGVSISHNVTYLLTSSNPDGCISFTVYNSGNGGKAMGHWYLTVSGGDADIKCTQLD